VAIVLGRDCTVSLNDSAVGGVRTVTATETTQEIEVRPFGSRSIFTYTTGYGVEVQIETIDADAVDAAVTLLESGDVVAVTGDGFSFYGVVTNVTNSQPLDDVCVYTISVRASDQSYR
jgi:ABC-type amino acid transport substrate-binding protein